MLLVASALVTSALVTSALLASALVGRVARRDRPVRTGGRVAVLTNAMDPGVLAVTACTARGQTVAPLSGRRWTAWRRGGISLISSQCVVDLRSRHQEWLVQQEQPA